MVIRETLGLELHPGVDSSVPRDFELQQQVEIIVFSCRGQKLVTRCLFFERTCCDRPIFNAPGLGGVAFPPEETLAVK